jgi:hypothetical protein
MSDQKIEEIDNSSIIQVGGNIEIIFNILETIKSINDIDGAIRSIHAHINRLQWRKGWLDARIPCAIISALTISIAFYKWSNYSIMLIFISMLFMAIGAKVSKIVSCINVEVTAANSVLVELYKQKIISQTTSNENLSTK